MQPGDRSVFHTRCVEAGGGSRFHEFADHLRCRNHVADRVLLSGHHDDPRVWLLRRDRGQVGWRVLRVAVGGEPQNPHVGEDGCGIVGRYDACRQAPRSVPLARWRSARCIDSA